MFGAEQRIDRTDDEVDGTHGHGALEEGTSKGTLIVPLSEVPMAGVSGTLKGGPFEASTPIKAGSISESFTGASTCGVPQGKLKIVKPVKAGTFSTSEVEFR